jgi:hypothetical protein
MPDPKFSEFQFAYSVTRELESEVFTNAAVPHFPSQNQEGYLGYDLNFSNGVSSLFIQYKRSKRLDDGRAIDEQWDTYGEQFFRFKVRTSDNGSEPEQHKLLTRRARERPVYYVAPEFIKWADYQQYARDSNILAHSAFIDCEDAPMPCDSDQHYICHRPEDYQARFFSEEPQTIDRVGPDETYSRLMSLLLEAPPQFRSFQEARNEFRQLRSGILEKLDRAEQIEPADYSAENQLEWIQEQQRFFEELLGISAHFFETKNQI